MKVPDVRRNLVPDTWTADGEGALPVNWVRVLMTTAALVVEERRRRRPDSSPLNLMILLRGMSSMTYDDRLKLLGLERLELRRLHTDLL